MKLDEAVKEIEEPAQPVTEGNLLRYAEAVQLGLEALKRYIAFRHAGIIPAYELLAHEDKE